MNTNDNFVSEFAVTLCFLLLVFLLICIAYA